ncbi:MAG TPA: flagellar hook-associated protein FlgK [Micropepsaceae bacterium]|nr:flagellar hook-associated protein FlgK [Micropepsaceae bacterium]
MSLEAILSSGLSSLLTNSAALRVASNNIANANNPNYARRVVQQGPLVTGSQIVGVKIEEIQRISNAFLDTEVLRANSGAARFDVQSEIMKQLDTALGQPGDGQSIGSQLSAVYAALGQASLDPTSLASRLGTAGKFQGLARSISDLSGAVADLRTSTNQQIGDAVSEANVLIRQIYDLNPSLHRAVLSGDTASPLLDERDTLVKQLSQLVDVRTAQQPDGRLYVSTTDGVQLVGDNYAQLSYSSTTGPAFSPIMVQTINGQTGQAIGTPRTFDAHATSGKLAGLVELRDGTLVSLGEELGALAQSVSLAFNAAHNASTAVPPPQSMTGRQTGLLSTDSLSFTGATTLGIVDANSGALQHKVAIDFGAGTLSVDGGGASPIGGTVGSFVAALNTALGADGSADFTDGVLKISATGSNGVVLADEPGNTASRGGIGFSQFFGLNDLFEASGNAIVTTGLQSTDTAGFAPGGAITLLLKGPHGERVGETSVAVTGTTIDDMITALNTAFTGKATFALDANGQMQVTPAANYSGYELEVTQDTTARGTTGESFTSLFGIGIGEKMARARNFNLTAVLQSSPQLLAFAQPTLTGATALSSVVASAGDNRGLLALQDLFNQSHVFSAGGALSGRNATFNDYAAAFYQDAGTRGNTIDVSKKAADTRLQIATQNQSEKSGVNLDEELANMMVLQQAYNAGARLISVAQQLSDELMKVMGG